MPRRGQISKRDVLPDPLYNSKLVTKLINNVMYDGMKGVAQTIVYDAFKLVEEKIGQNALEVFQEAPAHADRRSLRHRRDRRPSRLPHRHCLYGRVRCKRRLLRLHRTLPDFHCRRLDHCRRDHFRPAEEPYALFHAGKAELRA